MDVPYPDVELENTDRGIPYSIAEIKIVIRDHRMDEYHRDLLKWLVNRIERTPKV